MTRPKLSRSPVSSFSPELLVALLKGAREKVEIPCPDQRTMQYLQMRIQMLRGAMGREGHPQYALVTRARTTRTWNAKVSKNTDCVLVIQPNDSQFNKVLKDAGIEATQNDQDLLDETITPSIDPNGDDSITSPIDPYAKFK
jgi:hypothetical protein